ncbi:hypothetical protein C7M84_022838 [Penaeus vannamei]|uniref:Uncharacterized protein n=1 Tax=Penaeus vannamei TaxID=6689 RepID=A0A423U5L3_PENVA|nr:hypothetical protein C7M84_022838 [Penaeus vannamei]
MSNSAHRPVNSTRISHPPPVPAASFGPVGLGTVRINQGLMVSATSLPPLLASLLPLVLPPSPPILVPWCSLFFLARPLLVPLLFDPLVAPPSLPLLPRVRVSLLPSFSLALPSPSPLLAPPSPLSSSFSLLAPSSSLLSPSISIFPVSFPSLHLSPPSPCSPAPSSLARILFSLVAPPSPLLAPSPLLLLPSPRSSLVCTCSILWSSLPPSSPLLESLFSLCSPLPISLASSPSHLLSPFPARPSAPLAPPSFSVLLPPCSIGVGSHPFPCSICVNPLLPPFSLLALLLPLHLPRSLAPDPPFSLARPPSPCLLPSPVSILFLPCSSLFARCRSSFSLARRTSSPTLLAPPYSDSARPPVCLPITPIPTFLACYLPWPCTPVAARLSSTLAAPFLLPLLAPSSLPLTICFPASPLLHPFTDRHLCSPLLTPLFSPSHRGYLLPLSRPLPLLRCSLSFS